MRLVMPAVACLAAVTGMGCSGSSDAKETARHLQKQYIPVEDEARTHTVKAASPVINARTHMTAGRVAEEKGDMIAALEQYNLAVDKDPDLILAYSRMGVILNKLGHHDIADEIFQKALAKDDTAIYLHNNQGFSYMLQGRLDEAEACFRRALDIEPKFARARMNLGILLARKERYEDAFVAFREASNEALAHYNVGYMYSRAGDIEMAEVHYRLALSCNASFEPARQALEKLTQVSGQY